MKPPLGDRSLYLAENVPGSHQADFKSHHVRIEDISHLADTRVLQVNAATTLADAS
jgi:hypothetical protein